MTKTFQFKCTLESDLVLSQTSSSEGNQQTLDFIPGNNFLGIVASKLYVDGSAESLQLFHSGKVRYGDAHPSVDGIRGLRVPASMYYPKLKRPSEECYIHHLTNHEDDTIKSKQLKQCRGGFYSFDESTSKGKPISIEKNFAIKSAYDSKKRRSEDSKMFGYESLPKGLVMFFEIESELDDQQNQQLVATLCGKRHIGHSRSAEFGLVNIELCDYWQMGSSLPDAANDFVTVYADGRLIFFDEYGEPTCCPSAADLGIDSGTIDWTKSQIRTFQYAPWNGKRHTYEAERCGIEKGSVFVVRLNGCSCPETSQYVGFYRNEGFGKVIYNPAFLKGNAAEPGKALFTLADDKHETAQGSDVVTPPNSPLIDYLSNRKQAVANNQEIYGIVQDTVKEFEPLFKSGTFASQWGSIRSIAMITSDSATIIDDVKRYLDHGVAKEKWEERGRLKRLIDFMDKNKDKDLQSIMINLSSEMAKKCKARKED